MKINRIGINIRIEIEECEILTTDSHQGKEWRGLGQEIKNTKTITNKARIVKISMINIEILHLNLGEELVIDIKTQMKSIHPTKWLGKQNPIG